MAGGVKRPVNIFRLRTLGEPQGVFNWRLWFAVISFGLMGAARGIDEGLISGAFNSRDFRATIHLSRYSTVEQTDIKGNVSAMVQIGSVAGALFAFVICDRVGRIWATRELCLLWILGIVIFMAGGARGSLGAVYAGRFIAGLGVGQTPVVGPVYIAEIAPASVRGLCTCFFTGFVYLGIVLAYFTNYGCQVHLGDATHARWLVPTSLHIMMAGLILILSFFHHESPRYLIKRGRADEATAVMAHLRQLPAGHEYIQREIATIQAAWDTEVDATRGASWSGRLKELFCVPSNLYRFYLSAMVQVLSQWSGAGSITLYAPDFFRILGITGDETSLLVTAIFGIVKLCAAVLCALFLVDAIGRKRALLAGITLQCISMVYVASFLTSVPQLGVTEGFTVPAGKVGASRGAVAMIYLSGFGWALGWNSMQYLLTAELFPLRIRALATSLAMGLHFANQYGNSRAVPNMLLPAGDGGISPLGTFWFFAAVTVLGGFWVWLSVPETAGVSLEKMDRIFSLSWYKVGLHGYRASESQENILDEEKRGSLVPGRLESVDHASVSEMEQSRKI